VDANVRDSYNLHLFVGSLIPGFILGIDLSYGIFVFRWELNFVFFNEPGNPRNMVLHE